MQLRRYAAVRACRPQQASAAAMQTSARRTHHARQRAQWGTHRGAGEQRAHRGGAGQLLSPEYVGVRGRQGPGVQGWRLVRGQGRGRTPGEGERIGSGGRSGDGGLRRSGRRQGKRRGEAWLYCPGRPLPLLPRLTLLLPLLQRAWRGVAVVWGRWRRPRLTQLQQLRRQAWQRGVRVQGGWLRKERVRCQGLRLLCLSRLPPGWGVRGKGRQALVEGPLCQGPAAWNAVR